MNDAKFRTCSLSAELIQIKSYTLTPLPSLNSPISCSSLLIKPAAPELSVIYLCQKDLPQHAEKLLTMKNFHKQENIAHIGQWV